MPVFKFRFRVSVGNLDLLSFPTRRSSDLRVVMLHLGHGHVEITPQLILQAPQHLPLVLQRLCIRDVQSLKDKDRKSTRLNSSHANSSYAVFFLKKKRLVDKEKGIGEDVAA